MDKKGAFHFLHMLLVILLIGFVYYLIYTQFRTNFHKDVYINLFLFCFEEDA